MKENKFSLLRIISKGSFIELFLLLLNMIYFVLTTKYISVEDFNQYLLYLARHHNRGDGVKVGDLVVNKTQTWPNPRLVVEFPKTAKSLIGILFEEEIKYVHYKHLEVINASR